MGREFARLFARDGYPLVLVARNEARLRELAAELAARHGTRIEIIPADLAHPDAATELKAELDRRRISVEILVNNAGAGVYGLFHDADWNATGSMLTLNAITPTHLTRLLLPDMLRRGLGKVLFVASTAAFQPGPLMACYFASKAYLLSLAEALANELDGSGVTVTAFCPGPVRTEFQKRSGTEGIRENVFAADAADVVADAYRGLMLGKTLVIPGFLNKILAALVRLAPRKLVTRVTRFIEEQKKGL